MRESNFHFAAQNKACVCITSALYDRRAIDCTSPLPLVSTLTHLSLLTSTHPPIREILCSDGGLERLISILRDVGRKQREQRDKIRRDQRDALGSCASSSSCGSSSTNRKEERRKRRQGKGKDDDLETSLSSIAEDHHPKKNPSCPFKPFPPSSRPLDPSGYGSSSDDDGGRANADGTASTVGPVQAAVGLTTEQKHTLWTWSLAFQCVVNIGVRGSESVRTRVVEAGVVPLIVSVLGGFLHEADRRKHRSEILEREARRLRAAAHGVLGPVVADHQAGLARPAPPTVAAPAPMGPITTVTTGPTISRLDIPLDDAIVRSVSPAISVASNGPATPSTRSLAGVSAVAANIFAWPPPTSELGRQAIGQGPSASSSATSSWASMDTDEGPFRTPEEDGGSGSGDADEDELMEILDDDDSEEAGERRSSRRRDRAIRRRGTIKPTVVVEAGRRAGEGEAMDINDDVDATPRIDETRLQADVEATPVPPPLPVPTPHPVHDLQPTQVIPPPPTRTAEGQRPAPMAAAAQLCYREEDVVLSLQLLAYLSKYAHVRDVFHEPADRKTLELTYGTNSEAARAVASFAGKVRQERGEREKEKEKTGGGAEKEKEKEKGKARKGPVACPIEALVGRCKNGKSTGSTFSSVSSQSGGGGGRGQAPTTNAAGEVVTINPLSTNVFSFVERFTHQPSTHDRHAPPFSKPVLYWAGVVMRNACRKDESRGGIRRCANMQCGKWEAFPREFAKCRRCRKAKYCSKSCQSKAWQLGHRFWCCVKGESEGEGAEGATEEGGQERRAGRRSHRRERERDQQRRRPAEPAAATRAEDEDDDDDDDDGSGSATSSIREHGRAQTRDLRRTATLANANVAGHPAGPTGRNRDEEEEDDGDVADPLTNLDELNAELVQAATAVEVVEDEGEVARQMMEDGLADFGTTVFASEFGNVVARTGGAGPTTTEGR